MYCPNCGKEVRDDWKVCPNCGEKLKKENDKGLPKQEQIMGNNTDQTSPKEKKSGNLWMKIVGWGLTVFNLFFALLYIQDTFIGSFCLVISALLFCPVIVKHFNKKFLCVVIAIIIYIVGWKKILAFDGGDSKTHEESNPVVQTQQDDTTTSNTVVESKVKVDSDNQNDVVDSVKGESEQVDKENIKNSEYYPTDEVKCGDWNITIWLVWTSIDDIFDDTIVNCYCDIKNNSTSTQSFYASDLGELDNNGLIGEASSDYDGQKITAGSSIKTTIRFSFPENSNTTLSLMKINTPNDLIILFTAKPQGRDELNSFAGTYESDSGMKLVFTESSPNVYRLFQFNTIEGPTETTVNMDENNRFYIGACKYIWLPDESAIYVTDVDGEPDRDTYHFKKKNFERIETVSQEQIEKDKNIYYSPSGLRLAISKKGKSKDICAYSTMDDGQAKIEFKGSFSESSDMKQPVSVILNEGSDKHSKVTISYPGGGDSSLVLMLDSVEYDFSK